MEKFVLDTSIFFNIEQSSSLGKTTREIIENLTQKTIDLKKQKKAVFYLPPRVVDELKSFFEKEEDFIKKFLSSIIIQSPDYGKININGEVFLKLITDVRGRAYRGLAIAEEELKNMAYLVKGRLFKSKVELQKAIGPVIKKFRERYRHATRFGFLDSPADLDLIILAKEIDGFLVSVDEGVINWGRIFGVKEMPVSLFERRCDLLLAEKH